MTFGEKLSKLRRENNYTQEQFASLLGVSRQSVSKWESDMAYPETEKLIRIGQIFDCSMDYLLDENCTDRTGAQPAQTADNAASSLLGRIDQLMRFQSVERKSEREVFGMPLYHIGRNAHGFFAIGLKAKGVFTIGLLSRGIVSLGLLSFGVISIGVLALGLLSFGSFALGLVSMGAIALGLIAFGAIAVGIVTGGALSVGAFAAGALAIGKYAAIGDEAHGIAAIGFTKAVGTLFCHQHPEGKLTADMAQFCSALDESVPAYLAWAKNLFLWLFG